MSSKSGSGGGVLWFDQLYYFFSSSITQHEFPKCITVYAIKRCLRFDVAGYSGLFIFETVFKYPPQDENLINTTLPGRKPP